MLIVSEMLRSPESAPEGSLTWCIRCCVPRCVGIPGFEMLLDTILYVLVRQSASEIILKLGNESVYLRLDGCIAHGVEPPNIVFDDPPYDSRRVVLRRAFFLSRDGGSFCGPSQD